MNDCPCICRTRLAEARKKEEGGVEVAVALQVASTSASNGWVLAQNRLINLKVLQRISKFTFFAFIGRSQLQECWQNLLSQFDELPPVQKKWAFLRFHVAVWLAYDNINDNINTNTPDIFRPRLEKVESAVPNLADAGWVLTKIQSRIFMYCVCVCVCVCVFRHCFRKNKVEAHFFQMYCTMRFPKIISLVVLKIKTKIEHRKVYTLYILRISI